ncbi:MAG: helix-turn-helix domain containing protein [Syntrophorhabdaceae bacterium]|nr:helix-turn-helix domain containing protein [Syntrophorhabdaceae bacterium]MDD5242652.1 helix-turn-helix domain containing protein [Syntrophorhabdaceae bacterium]
MNEKVFEGRPAKEIADHPGVHYTTVRRVVHLTHELPCPP